MPNHGAEYRITCRYEYKLVGATHLERDLNEFGREGWRVIERVPNGFGPWLFLMEREVWEDVPPSMVTE